VPGDRIGWHADGKGDFFRGLFSLYENGAGQLCARNLHGLNRPVARIARSSSDARPASITWTQAQAEHAFDAAYRAYYGGARAASRGLLLRFSLINQTKSFIIPSPLPAAR
jgi:hypothetical protein